MGIVFVFLVMFLLLFLTIPIPFAIGISVMGYVVLFRPSLDFGFIAQNMYVATDNFPLMAVPFFILAGDLMKTGGLSLRLINFAKSLVGHLTGGFGIITVLACMFFGAISGSGPATCAAIGAVMMPAMLDNGYEKDYSAALICCAGVLGVIIPPSIPMVMYGQSVNASISTMFMAGFIPGVLGGLTLMVVVYFISKKRGYSGTGVPFSLRAAAASLKSGFWALLMPVFILGGIYGGVFTATEAAAIAVVYGVVVGLFVYRELTWKNLLVTIGDAAMASASTLIVAGVGSTIAKIMALEKAQELVRVAVYSISDSPVVILLLINIALLVIGCLISTIPAIIIFAPVLYAAVSTFNMNTYHFGLMMIFNLGIGMITPPVGLNLFVMTGMANISVVRITRAAMPFMIALGVALLFITYIPDIALAMPRLFGLLR